MKKLLLPIFLILTALILSSTVVLGQGQNNSQSRREAVKEKIEARLKAVKEKLASKSALRKEKLEDVKQKVCDQRKAAIVRRSTRLAERAERQLTNFSSKADKVDNYYNNTLIPQGVVLENYDDLLADIEAKKQAVQEAVDSAKETANSFDCSGEDPKGQIKNYRTDMQNAISALKEYRTSIKNLIVAVRTAKAKTATNSADN